LIETGGERFRVLTHNQVNRPIGALGDTVMTAKTAFRWLMILLAVALLVACSHAATTDVGTATPMDKLAETVGEGEPDGTTEPVTLTPGEHRLTVEGQERRYLVIALGFSIPCYYLGKWCGGKADFTQVLAVVMLASVVSLPIFVLVDLSLYNPEQVITFATTGVAVQPYVTGDNWLVWIIQQSYAYLAMGWQGIVTLIGLTVIHRNRWFANIPGIVVGNGIFMVFLLLIRDYVALII
jgi:hypothetical protein